MSTVDKVGNHRDDVNLSQLYGVIRRKEHKKYLQFFIEKQHDINYKIPETEFLQHHRPELIGCTALHLALSHDNFESFNLLLQNNADYNVKNYKQKTILHRAVEENFIKQEIAVIEHRFKDHDKDFTIGEVNSFIAVKDINERENSYSHDNWRMWGKFEDEYVDAILLALLETKKVLKGSDDDGISLLHAACLTNNIEAVDFLLKNGADVNAPSSSPIFDGFTSLHFAVKYSSVEVVKILLANRAKILPPNSKFMSPVDILVDQNIKIMEWLHAKNKLPYRNCILDYVENEEKLISIMSTNFETHSDFHANLCSMLNNFSSDSTIFPGYTGLHFASFFNIDTAKLLIKNGADIEAVNKYGVSPLDILETRATIDDLHFILSQKQSWKCIALEDHKTKLLDLITSMNDLNTFNSFLREIDNINLRVPDDTPLWSGYTTLHLVVTFSETVRKTKFLNNIFNCDRSNLKVEYAYCCQEQQKTHRDRIVLCLIKNADVTIQDRRGRTPINLAFRQRNMDAVKLMFKNHNNTVNPTDDDNLSHLHIACIAKNVDLVEKLLANGADVNSAIKSSFKWHCDYHRCTLTDVFDLVGSTPLHLSVATSNLDLAKLLLKYGAEVNAKDALGLTPLHRIFVMQQLWEIDKGLFSDSPIFDFDSDMLFLMSECPKRPKDDRISKELLSSPNLKESVVDDFGLSHLHIAIDHVNEAVARKLLDEGSNVNLAITCPENLTSNHPLFVLRRFDGYTPLHMIRDRELKNCLLKYGADFLTRRGDGMNKLFVELQDLFKESSALYVKALKDNESLRARLEEEFGWTLLHVACHLLDVHFTRFALSIGVDVNSRTKDDSPMYPGCTALCIFIINSYKCLPCNSTSFYLLDSGADVMLADTRGNTPIHYCYMHKNSMHTAELLKHIENFNVNPTNHEGISVFHLACLWNYVDVIRNYLDHGVDVNRPVEFFGDKDLAGCSPLHLVVTCRPWVGEEGVLSSSMKLSKEMKLILPTVELLLKRGADVNAENALGNTPLHVVTEHDPPRDTLLKMMFSYGANVNVKNVHGKTTFELLLDTRITSQELELFLKLGCRMNAFNEITQVGYISLFLESINRSWEGNTLKKLAWSCPSIREVDCKGRTAIHNIVSSTTFSETWGYSTIGYFIEIIRDIDRQDSSGMTALHLATRFLNFGGIEALLSHGCDVNVIDSIGKTAFTYVLGTEFLCNSIKYDIENHQRVVQIFIRIFHHITQRGLYVNDVNREAFVRASRKYESDRLKIGSEYEKIKVIKIGDTGFTLGDFLSETKTIVYYSKIPREDRDVIEQFFVNPRIDSPIFQSWMFLCRLQLEKALQRAELVDNAKDAMNFLLGFPLPDLCYEVVEKFLPNEDLKRLVVAASL